jgi:hypothetical protein
VQSQQRDINDKNNAHFDGNLAERGVNLYDCILGFATGVLALEYDTTGLMIIY